MPPLPDPRRSRRDATRPTRFEIGWYNGWSPEERRRSSSVQAAAVRNGAIAYPSRCTICDVRGSAGSDNPVWFHDEDYADPLAAFPICRRCHRTLHQRFEEPFPWLSLIAQHGDGTRWFEALTMDAGSLRKPFAVTYPDGAPRDRFTSATAAHPPSI